MSELNIDPIVALEAALKTIQDLESENKRLREALGKICWLLERIPTTTFEPAVSAYRFAEEALRGGGRPYPTTLAPQQSHSTCASMSTVVKAEQGQ